MATAAATVYWPQHTLHDALGVEMERYALRGFRVDAHTVCVVELVPDNEDGEERAGADVIGIAAVVSAEQHDARSGADISAVSLSSPVGAGGALKKHQQQKALLRVHLVVSSGKQSGWLMRLLTNRSTSRSTTPALVHFEDEHEDGDEPQRGASGAVRHCNMVFYDAQLAAKGCLVRCSRTLSPGSAFHAPLTQIDGYFVKRLEHARVFKRRSAQSTAAQGLRGLVETVGFYALYLPSTLLVRASAVVSDAVGATIPTTVPVVGGKRAKDASRFLELLSCHLHSLSRVPHTVRCHYLLTKSRRASDEEVVEVVEAWNYGCYVALDAAVGRLLAGVVFQILLTQLQARELSPAAFLEILRSNVVWLMGAPAGFKLNAPLASILGNGILLWFDLWEYALSFVIGSEAPWSELLRSSCISGALSFVWRHIGATLQLTLLSDALTFFTWNSYWVYQYFTKLNMLQFGLFSSLWKLFLGKKNNVLRKRVDSCEYDVSQLLLGTLLFTILFFIVTTNMVFFVYFGLVRLSIFSVQAALWFPVVCLRTVPVASVLYRWWNPTFFVAGVRLDARKELHRPTKSLSVRSVGIGGGRRVGGDAQAQQRIHEATAPEQAQNQEHKLRNAYFQVVPIASSASSLFSRLGEYSKALSRHYSLGAVARSWFFGSHISPIPLTILFECPGTESSRTVIRTGAGLGSSESSSTLSSPVSPSTKKSL